MSFREAKEDKEARRNEDKGRVKESRGQEKITKMVKTTKLINVIDRKQDTTRYTNEEKNKK